jgi:hypothetical protein
MQEVPYWIDDESVRQSMIECAPLPMSQLNQAEIEAPKPRFGLEAVQSVNHPLLGAAPTLRLIKESTDGAHGAPRLSHAWSVLLAVTDALQFSCRS